MAWKRRILPLERATVSTVQAAATRSWRDNAPARSAGVFDRREQNWKPDRDFQERKRMPPASSRDWLSPEGLPAMSTVGLGKYNHTLPQPRIPAGNPCNQNSRLRFGPSAQQSQRDASRHSRVRQDRRRLAHESEPSLLLDVRSPRIKRLTAPPLQPAPRGRSFQ